jgi:hypothetical protein
MPPRQVAPYHNLLLGQDVTWEPVTAYRQDREVKQRTQIEKIDY